MTFSKKELGRKIKQAREFRTEKDNKRYTGKMLSEEIGISRSYLGDIESGRTYPSYALLSKIANACDVPLSFFDTKASGTTLRKIRTEKNISLENLSKNTNISPDMLQKLENNKNTDNLSIKKWLSIGENLGLSKEEILKIAVQSSFDKSVFNSKDNDKYLNYIKEKLLNYQKKNQEAINSHLANQKDDIIKIPIVGTIRAGEPILAYENIEGYFPTDRQFLNSDKEYFYLKVKGDSMDKEFKEGSLLLIEKQPVIENGDIAVVLINGLESTVKKVYFDKNLITLMPQSSNPDYQPKIVDTTKDDLMIIGKVSLAIKKY